MQVGTTHVFDVQIGAVLVSSENPDLAKVDCQIYKNVDHDVESLTRRVAADSRWTKDGNREIVTRVLKQDRLALSLESGVIAQWFKGEGLSDLCLRLDAVDRRRRGIYETSHARAFGGTNEWLEGREVNALTERRMEVVTWIIGYARQMNSVGATNQHIADGPGVSNVAHDQFKPRVISYRVEHLSPVPAGIKRTNLIACFD